MTNRQNQDVLDWQISYLALEDLIVLEDVAGEMIVLATLLVFLPLNSRWKIRWADENRKKISSFLFHFYFNRTNQETYCDVYVFVWFLPCVLNVCWIYAASGSIHCREWEGEQTLLPSAPVQTECWRELIIHSHWYTWWAVQNSLKNSKPMGVAGCVEP